MKPRRTHDSNAVISLAGGTEDNDLWVARTTYEDGTRVIISVWELTDKERQAVAAGANIELTVLGDGMPPVAMHTTTVALGKSDERQS